MPSSLVELARQAAAASRADGRAAREAPVLPATRYRGVHQRDSKYAATLWNPFSKKGIRLGSYATAVEAAYAYDAAARSVLGRRARPNFPELSPAPAATAREVARADLAASRRAPKPPRQQQPVRRHRALLIRCWTPAPAGAAAQHPERASPSAFAYRRKAAPQYTQLHYRPGSAAAAVAFVPGVPDLNDPIPDTSASTKLSSAESSSAATVPNRRELPHMPAMVVEPDQSVVGNNFTDSSAA